MSVIEGNGPNQYKLQDKHGECIVYIKNSSSTEIDLTSAKGKFRIIQINPADGSVFGSQQTINAGKLVTINLNGSADIVVWVVKI